MQKEKVDIDDEKGAQISVVAKHFVTQMWSEIMIMNTNKLYITFLLITKFSVRRSPETS